MTVVSPTISFKTINAPAGGIPGLRAQILANYSVIDPDNADTILVIIIRKKNEQELLDWPTVTYNTEDMSEALLVTHNDKAKKTLMRASSPWGDYETPLRKLLAQTSEVLGPKILRDYPMVSV